MASRLDLQDWVVHALEAHGGKATIVQSAKHIWENHESELRASGDLFYTWQYDMRWACTRLRERATSNRAHRVQSCQRQAQSNRLYFVAFVDRGEVDPLAARRGPWRRRSARHAGLAADRQSVMLAINDMLWLVAAVFAAASLLLWVAPRPTRSVDMTQAGH